MRAMAPGSSRNAPGRQRATHVLIGCVVSSLAVAAPQTHPATARPAAPVRSIAPGADVRDAAAPQAVDANSAPARPALDLGPTVVKSAIDAADADYAPSSAPRTAFGTAPPSTTPSEFLQFLQESYGTQNLRAVVFLNSPGGRVLASMEFGTLLRRMGAAAVVAGVYPNGSGGTVMTNGQCFSACVYAFMGGRKRVVPASSQIGIHRMFAYEQEYDASNGEEVVRRRYDNGTMGAVLKRYTSQMGVSPSIISEAEHIPSDGLKILSRNEIRRYRLGVPHL